jgi:hypothetical protein
VSGKPIKFVGVGEKMDALEPFYPERMAQRILGMGDMLTLYEKAQEAIKVGEGGGGGGAWRGAGGVLGGGGVWGQGGVCLCGRGARDSVGWSVAFENSRSARGQ